MSFFFLIDGQKLLALCVSPIDRQTLLNWSSFSLTDGQMPLVISEMSSLIDGQTPLVLSGISFLSLIDGQTPLVLSLSLIDRQTLLNWSSLSLTDGQMPLVMPGMTFLSLTDGRTPLVMSWMSSLSLSGGQTPLVLSGTSSFRQNRRHPVFSCSEWFGRGEGEVEFAERWSEATSLHLLSHKSDRKMARDMFTNGSKPHQCFCAPNGWTAAWWILKSPGIVSLSLTRC